MKLNVDQQHRKVEGALESKEAGIRSTVTMMAALAGLYSDPKLAIVREYATNMLDAYTRLKRLRPDAPFWAPVVHLPNALEPYIEFKDFGIGMDYEEVWDIFTDFGGSTKQDSNDEVGGLGLGCKTAFTYAPTWFVESRFDGMMHVIHASKNEVGKPEWHRMASIPTDEPNGVTVRIPVKANDFSEFRERLAKVLAYYPMEVKVVGGSGGFEFKKPVYVLSGTNWGLRQREQYGVNYSHVIMGNIPYKLDLGQFHDYAALSGIDLGDFNLDLTLSVGEADITPSREGLMYTDRTKARVARAVRTFVNEVRAKAEADVAKAETEWEALTLLHGSWGVHSLRQHLAGITWRGQTIDPNVGIRRKRVDLMPKLPAGADLSIETNGDNAKLYTGTPEEVNLTPGGEHQWVYLNDVGRGAKGRIREAVYPQVVGSYGGRRRRRYHRSTARAYVFEGEGLTAERLSELLGGYPVELVSSLPIPFRAQRQAGQKRAPVPLKVLGDSDFYDGTVPEDAETVFFVRLERNEPMAHSTHGQWTTYTLRKLYEGAKAVGLIDHDVLVYGIPRTLAKYEKEEGWVDFLDYIMPLVADKVKEYEKDIATVAAWEATLGEEFVEFLREHENDLLALSLDPVLSDFITEAVRVEGLRDTVAGAKQLAVRAGVDLKDRKPVSRGDKMLAAVYMRYPMLKTLAALSRNNYYTKLRDHKDVILDYIEAA